MAASGRLSEIFGEKTLDMDRFSLSVGYRRVSQATWDSKTELTKEIRDMF
jgi:acyl-homoserine lactone acylase PvdQ